jgi:hypothetical protein
MSYYNGNIEYNPVMRRTCHCRRICYECHHISLPFCYFNFNTLNTLLLQNHPIVQSEVVYDMSFDEDMVNRIELPVSLQNTTRNRRKNPFKIFVLPYGNSTKIPRK